MDCPKCDTYIPDEETHCPKCGEAVWNAAPAAVPGDTGSTSAPAAGAAVNTGVPPVEVRSPMIQKKGLNATHFLLLIIVAGLAAVGFFILHNKDAQTPVPASKPAVTKKVKASPPKTAPEKPAPEEEPAGDDDDTGADSYENDNGTFDQNDGEENSEENSEPVDDSDDAAETTDDTDSSEDLYETGSTGGFADYYTPGAEVDIERYTVKRKITIFDFYSQYCGPCLKISPLLEQLDEKRDDIVVVKVDINRENVRGIDWAAPVVKQYQIRSVPHFVIYDDGIKSHSGRAAYSQVMQYLRDEGIK